MRRDVEVALKHNLKKWKKLTELLASEKYAHELQASKTRAKKEKPKASKGLVIKALTQMEYCAA